ncbi:F-box protein [Legionella lansingensis]|nr:F-box protein [Legionella lansingensis]
MPGKTRTNTPARLQDIVLAAIAQNPDLSISIIHNKEYEIPHIKEALINSLFIQLLPVEIQCEIISFLPIQDWESLFKVSKAWQQQVVTAANLYLNSIKNQLAPIQNYNFESLMKKLMNQVHAYDGQANNYGRHPNRSTQINALFQLNDEIPCLTKPLAKLFHCQKKVGEIQSAIEKEYSYGSFFVSIPQNSRLYSILLPVSTECRKLTQRLKKAMECAKFSPEHPVAKLFSDALLEIKNLQSLKMEIESGREEASLAL